ncbi:hypothetical protein HK099_002503 [Clydaea vesicula]|uniref:Uncharacterized protein n=1 Tax=Clydaea vesicula TaxID=447962 RepID=A0AAD5U2E8_9FUNG|nr:hypothetical protein HK099_002503 [Clydaea vesicula]
MNSIDDNPFLNELNPESDTEFSNLNFDAPIHSQERNWEAMDKVGVVGEAITPPKAILPPTSTLKEEVVRSVVPVVNPIFIPSPTTTKQIPEKASTTSNVPLIRNDTFNKIEFNVNTTTSQFNLPTLPPLVDNTSYNGKNNGSTNTEVDASSTTLKMESTSYSLFISIASVFICVLVIGGVIIRKKKLNQQNRKMNNISDCPKLILINNFKEKFEEEKLKNNVNSNAEINTKVDLESQVNNLNPCEIEEGDLKKNTTVSKNVKFRDSIVFDTYSICSEDSNASTVESFKNNTSDLEEEVQIKHLNFEEKEKLNLYRKKKIEKANKRLSNCSTSTEESLELEFKFNSSSKTENENFTLELNTLNNTKIRNYEEERKVVEQLFVSPALSSFDYRSSYLNGNSSLKVVNGENSDDADTE